MSNYDNPYLSPQSHTHAPSLTEKGTVIPVGNGTRFVTYIIDFIVYYVASLMLGFVYGIACLAIGIQVNQALAFLLGIACFVAYYVILESTTQRTIGKILMGTIVVQADGSKPSFNQVLGRTFARMIPFEPFSFFG